MLLNCGIVKRCTSIEWKDQKTKRRCYHLSDKPQKNLLLEKEKSVKASMSVGVPFGLEVYVIRGLKLFIIIFIFS